jgi:SAM-dependent methyltransferase
LFDLICPACKSKLQEVKSAHYCSKCCTGYKDNIFLNKKSQYYFDVPNMTTDVNGSNGLARRLSRFYLRSSRVSNQKIEQVACMLKPNSRILIIGGQHEGNGINRLIKQNFNNQIVSIDIVKSENVDYCCDVHELIFESNTFDLVVCQAVLEHVLDPHVAISEIYRVTKPGGICYIEVPFLQSVHEGAYDFSRFTLNGLRWLTRDFKVIEDGIIAGTLASFLWSTRDLLRSVGLRHFAKLLSLPIRIINKLPVISHESDSANCFFQILEKDLKIERLRPKDLVANYKVLNK